jgi:hypothetical protein
MAVALRMTPLDIEGTPFAARACARRPQPRARWRHHAAAPESHRRCAAHVLELREGVQVGTRGDAELALLALDAPCGHLEVLPPQRVLNVLHGEPEGREAVG